MRNLRFFIVICLFAILTAPITLFFLAIEDRPRVVRQVSLSPEYVARAKQIIDAYRDQTNSEKMATAKILSADIDIAVNYLANRFGSGSASVSTINGSAQVILSLPIPENIFAGYLNLQATFKQTTWLPLPQSVKIGKLPLPDFLTNFMVSKLVDFLQNSPELSAGINAIQLIKISRNEVDITYRRSDGTTQQRNAIPFLSKEAQAQLFHYNALLVKNSARNGASVISLAEILQPLIHHATTQSNGGDAIAENRAIILVTVFHVLRLPLKLLVPEALSWSRPIRQKVTLDGRNDFAKHFMVSAAITAYADTELSDAIGLYKEIEDLRSGSGFSFNDIAANRAGTRFGEKAVASQASARKIQQLMAFQLEDGDMMPPWLDLPEHMTKAEFQHRFGGINKPAYKQMATKIENRVSTLRILRSD